MPFLLAAFALTTQVAKVTTLDGKPAVRLAGRVYPLEQTGADVKTLGRFTLRERRSGPEDALEELDNGKVQGSVDMAALKKDWFSKDDVWGDHQAANQMRYMDTPPGGGVYPLLTQVADTGPNLGLGVLSFKFSGPSGEPIGAQFLVRLHARPFSLERIKRLSTIFQYGIYNRPDLRLLQFGKNSLLIQEDGIEEVTPNGADLKKWVDVPKDAIPVDEAHGRWLIYSHRTGPHAEKFTVLAVDLKRRKSFPVYSFEQDPSSTREMPTIDSVSDFSDYLILSRPTPDGKDRENFTVHLPDGNRAAIAGPAYQTFGDYAVNRSEDEILVYSAKTGKLVKTLPLKKK